MQILLTWLGYFNSRGYLDHDHILEFRMPPTPSAQPLKVPATPSKGTEADKDKTPVANKQLAPSRQGTIAPNDISSPHELTAFVSVGIVATSNFLNYGRSKPF